MSVISKLAEEAVSEAQSEMIMEFRNFESRLYEIFALKVMEECIKELEVFDHHGTAVRDLMPNMVDAIRSHFGEE